MIFWRGGEAKGKAQVRIFRPNNWGYGMLDIYREVKSWHGTEPSGNGCLCQTSLRTYVLNEDDGPKD